MKLAHAWTKSVLSMMGTIMGAGLFALPAAFSYIGLGWGTLLFWLLAFGALATHLALTREILITGGKHRLSFFVKNYFGPVIGRLPDITYPLHLLSTSYAYLLLGGGFLAALFYLFSLRLPETIAIVFFWALFSVVSAAGNGAIARVETYVTAAMVAALLMLSALQWKVLSFEVLYATHPSVVAAIGIFLFAVSGFSGVGEVVEIVGRKKKASYSSVIVGTMISAFLTWIFGVIFFLASRGTLGERVIEFNSYVPSNYMWLLPVLGLTGIATSYITTSAELKSVFRGDFGLTKMAAAVLAYCLPISLLLVASHEFVRVISFIGAVFIGLNASMICWIAVIKIKPSSMTKVFIKIAYALLTATYIGFALYTIYKAF